jgi:hypothetical protein
MPFFIILSFCLPDISMHISYILSHSLKMLCWFLILSCFLSSIGGVLNLCGRPSHMLFSSLLWLSSYPLSPYLLMNWRLIEQMLRYMCSGF